MDASCHRHPLKHRELLSGEERRVCGLCGKEVTNGSAYECSRCNFTAHLHCAENPPPLVIDKRKIHEHTLTLLPRHVSFVCNACGLDGDKSPYVCLKCLFMIHGDCIEFPGVIMINRHEHRLACHFFFGPREWICGVCCERVDGRYGAYTCVKGCDYAVHLKCATRGDVWDGKELEGEPEEIEDFGPFEVISDELIVHFSHEHVLRLNDKDMIRDVVCCACSFPIASNPFYRCQQCDFFLHDTCAKRPRMILTFLHKHPLTLCTEDQRSGGPNGLPRCRACNLLYNGFRYSCLECKDDHIEFDVRCSSVSEPLEYTYHPQHRLLFYPRTRLSSCSLCNHHTLGYLLTCTECDFNLCFTCATSPREVNYKYDEHLLHQTIGEHVTTNPYWCDLCENKIEERSIHYKCSDCGPVLHTECALGSFRNMRPGFSFVTKHGHEYKVILNDRTSLLRCSQCHNDCHEPLLFMSTNTTTNDTIYLCSSTCFDTYVSV